MADATQAAIDLVKTDGANVRHIAQFGNPIEKAMAQALLHIAGEQ